jgi:RNA polymerase sigma-70 factor (ECF subfamily)
MKQSQDSNNQIRAIFNENFHSLVFASFGIVKNYEQAEDIVQDVFVKIWQNFDNIRNQTNVKAYLHKAVKNSSLNYLRDFKHIDKNKISVEDISIEEHHEYDSTDTDMLIKKVHEAVNKLPSKWHDAFILNKYEKLKYYEVAEKMDISVKTVEKYISKSLNFIRIELKTMIVTVLIFFFQK